MSAPTTEAVPPAGSGGATDTDVPRLAVGGAMEGVQTSTITPTAGTASATTPSTTANPAANPMAAVYAQVKQDAVAAGQELMKQLADAHAGKLHEQYFIQKGGRIADYSSDAAAAVATEAVANRRLDFTPPPGQQGVSAASRCLHSHIRFATPPTKAGRRLPPPLLYPLSPPPSSPPLRTARRNQWWWVAVPRLTSAAPCSLALHHLPHGLECANANWARVPCLLCYQQHTRQHSAWLSSRVYLRRGTHFHRRCAHTANRTAPTRQT